VIELAKLGATLVERLRGLIQSWEVQPQHAYLFGSTARQDGDASSDVDILLINTISRRQQVSVWAQQVEGLATRIRLWTGNDAEIVDLSAADVDRMQDDDAAILGSWRRDGILLAGVQLHLRQLALG